MKERVILDQSTIPVAQYAAWRGWLQRVDGLLHRMVRLSPVAPATKQARSALDTEAGGGAGAAPPQARGAIHSTAASPLARAARQALARPLAAAADRPSPRAASTRRPRAPSRLVPFWLADPCRTHAQPRTRCPGEGLAMSLEEYRRPRMIVLNPRSTACDAVRAMMDNHVGAVLVHDGQRLAGIVTDRDIALEVVAGDLDARSTMLRDIMSDEIATLGLDASIDDAVRTMRDHACRRVPVTEQGRPVGLVTLDDLLADGVIDAEVAGSVVKAQLEVAARFKPEGGCTPRRPRARSARTAACAPHPAQGARRRAYGRLIHAVERHSGLQQRDRAELARQIVLGCLCRR